MYTAGFSGSQHFSSPLSPPSPLQDSLVLDTPRLRRQVRRYGNDNMEEIVEMNELDEVIKSKAFVKVSFVQKYKCLFLDLL